VKMVRAAQAQQSKWSMFCIQTVPLKSSEIENHCLKCVMLDAGWWVDAMGGGRAGYHELYLPGVWSLS
jgi:hypothetical protein